MKLSVNAAFVDKNCSIKRAYSEGWTPLEIEAEELAAYIKKGYAFSAQFADEVRKSTNFLAADFIAVDIDGTMALADALTNPFISGNAAIIYTTPSHGKDGLDRFRIVFELPHTIHRATVWRDALTGLATRLNADMAATDGARLFYGSSNSSPIVHNRLLSEDALDELISAGQIIRAAAKKGERSAAVDGANYQTFTKIARDLPITCSDGSLRVLTEIAAYTRVHCPVHNDTKPSAFVTASSRGAPGIYCSACMKTFWLEGQKPKPYDYYQFEAETVALAAENNSTAGSERDWLNCSTALSGSTRSGLVIDSKYLPSLFVPGGAALVRSPKGSGKTRKIEGIVKHARQFGKSVLVIGHRRTLLRELSNRLGLKCYLDDVERHFDRRFSGKKGVEEKAKWSRARPDYYAVSVDSLAVRLPSPRPYDVIIIDECEQVLSHVCSKTIEKPEPILKVLQHYVANANSLYMFDADLNIITAGFVRRCRSKRSINTGADHTLQLVNIHKAETRTCQIFEDYNALLKDLLEDARDGKRLFVACNSKRRASGLERWLQDNVPDIRVLLVTADEKDTEEVREFLLDVRTGFLKYDAVIASPAIGTGIDITFPNHAQVVDTVYGLFDSQINTHYDVDQQIGRVRDPGAVKVWISDEEEYFETDASAIKLELVQTGQANDAITGFEEDGSIIFDHEHPLLSLRADAYAAIRASQNRLRHHFLEQKRHNGWTVVHIAPESEEKTPDPLASSYEEVDAAYVARVLAASRIEKMRYDKLLLERDCGNAIGASARFEVIRYEIEYFYGRNIDEELVRLDDLGRYRVKVERYEGLALHHNYNQIELYSRSFWETGNWYESFPNQTEHLLDALLMASGLFAIEGPNSEKTVSKSALEPFTALCRDREKSLQMEYRIKLRRDFDRDPVRVLNKLLDLIGLHVSNTEFEKVKGRRTYFYGLDVAPLSTLLGIVAHRKSVKAKREAGDIDRFAALLRNRKPLFRKGRSSLPSVFDDAHPKSAAAVEAKWIKEELEEFFREAFE